MKFLWESNSPWSGTGYGQQTRLMLKALLDLGHEPVCFAFYGLQGGAINYDGYRCVPGSDFESWGNDCIAAHMRRNDCELVITLMDLFVLKGDTWGGLEWPWAAWIPIDCDGVYAHALDILKLVPYPIAMSDFGAEQMRLVDVEPAARIWHAVDTEVFKAQDKAECREMLGLPQETYLVGMVMANKGDRKQYPAQFAAVKEWMDKNPDRDISIFIHTETSDQMAGWDMSMLTERMGLKGHVYSTDRYDTGIIPAEPEILSKIINSFDVLMNCSAGEGFGIPIIEAQACGVPVITHNVTAMPELTKYGYTVEPASRGLASHYGFQYVPSIEDMVYRLECVYRMMPDKEAALATRIWVEDNFSVPVIAAQWDEAIRTVQAIRKETPAPPASAVLS